MQRYCLTGLFRAVTSDYILQDLIQCSSTRVGVACTNILLLYHPLLATDIAHGGMME